MYNLGNFMQYYRPQFMQGEQFQQPQGMGQAISPGYQQPGYSQQTAGGYQPAQQVYQGTPAQIPMPQGPQGWQGQPWSHNMQAGGPNLQPYQPRMNMGMFAGRQTY